MWALSSKLTLSSTWQLHLILFYIHNWLSLHNLTFIVNMVSKHHLLILQTLALFGSFEMSEHLYFHCRGKKKSL